MMQSITKRKRFKALTILLLVAFVQQVFLPVQLYGKTNSGGEIQAAHGVGSGGDLVNLYTGDFNYNIPVLTVPGPNGGYPLNMSYSSAGVNMFSESSWVGLGWTLNPGSVNRLVNVIPDDFNNDEIKYDYHRKPFKSFELDLSSKDEEEWVGFVNPIYAGAKEASDIPVDQSIYYNNYYGFGYKIAKRLKLAGNDEKSLGMDFSYDTQQGIGYSPSVRIKGVGVNVGLTARDGINSVGLSYRYSNADKKNKEKSNFSASYGFGIPLNVGAPLTDVPTETRIEIGELQLAEATTLKGTSMNFPRFQTAGPLAWVTGTYTEVVAPKETVSRPAKGFLYGSQNDDKNTVRDFQRNTKPFYKGSDRLSTSVKGSDHFVYTAAGAGGKFEAYKSQIEVNSQTAVVGPVKEFINTADIGIGHGYQFSGGRGKIVGESYSGKIRADYYNSGSFSGNASDRLEKVYFRKVSDRTVESISGTLYDAWGQDKPVYPLITKSGDYYKNERKPKFEGDFSNGISINSSTTKGLTSRKNRQTIIQYLDHQEAKQIGFARGNGYFQGLESSSDEFKNRKHHIGEINIWEPGGTRYNYGHPVYVKFKTQLNFSANGSANGKNDVTDLYHPVNVQQYYEGGLELKNKTTIPEHATSWMLSSVTSPDYIDMSGDGPSQDDYGYWVKFNYEQTTDPSNDEYYRFRSPHEGANFSPQLKGLAHDDLGSISYGERENVYVQSIETKTHIAKFFTSKRMDGKEALLADMGIPAGGPPQYTHKLDRIELYLKDPKNPGQTTGSPLKTVHFKYDYELCKGVPGNDNETDDDNPVNQGGKLTLKELYYTYGKSSKGQEDRRRYKFGYGDNTAVLNNPKYQAENVDRWGNFRKVKNESNGNFVYGSNYPFKDMPYTEQTTPSLSSGEKMVNAPWRLKQITAPGGSESEIEYEEKDYAFVEDKAAMEMLDIVGFKEQDFSGRSRQGNSGPIDLSFTNRIYFRLNEQSQESLGGIDINNESQSKEFIKTHYLKGIDHVYLKAYVKLGYHYDSEGDYDFVESYAELNKDKCGVWLDQGVYYGYVTVKREKVGKLTEAKAVHPIRKAAFEKLKTDRSDIAFGREMFKPFGGLKDFANEVLGVVPDIQDLVLNPSMRFFINSMADKCRLNGWSKIRLSCSDRSKIGGGYRVASITVKDNWMNKTNIDQNIHRTRYKYELEDQEGEIMTSGVAYEPLNGLEENANFYMRYYTEKNIFAENNRRYHWEPTLLSYYPMASVGHSQVTIQQEYVDAGGQVIDLQTASAPYKIHSFFTPKDYPILSAQTEVHRKIPIIYPLNVPGYTNILTVDKARSQGYSVQTSDMPGRTKELLELSNDGDVIARQTYIYRDEQKAADSQNDNKRYLSSPRNYVKVLNENNQYEDRIIGQETEILIDGYENYFEKKSSGVLPEFNVILIPVPSGTPPYIPFLMLTPYPQTDVHTTEKEMVVIKKIHRQGLLKEIQTQKNQSEISTHIYAYDKEVGGTILTSVENEFDDQIYKLVRPGHYEVDYSSMKGAYRNILQTLPSMTMEKESYLPFYKLDNGGTIFSYFTQGDLVSYRADGELRTAHVLRIKNNKIRLVDMEGRSESASPITDIKVIVSGYQNQMGVVVGETSFMQLNESSNQISMGKILNASAVKFKSTWAPYCCIYDNSSSGGFNPYQTKERGVWRPWKSYVYNGEREYSLGSDTRENGIIKGPFIPFDWTSSSVNMPWIESSEVTLYGPGGSVVEQRDGLGIYNSSVLGFDGLVVGTAARAENSEIGFDSFEDLDYVDCRNQQFRFEDNGSEGTRVQIGGHTGDYCRVIRPGNKIELTKEMDCE